MLIGICNKKTGKERFWCKVNIKGENDCWLWNGCCGRDGYGIIRIDNKNKYVHRVAWELWHKKKIPMDKLACHSCDIRNCCNPKHLFIGTYHDNNSDRDKKGRNGSIKLTRKQVIRIRRLYKYKRRNGGKVFSHGDLAEYFRVSRTQIMVIVNYKQRINI